MASSESSVKQFLCFENALKMFISAIIFLNMIEFEENGPNVGCKIKDSSMKAVEALAELFESSSIELKQSLTGKIIPMSKKMT